MSGQKYKRTNFEEDDSNSLADGGTSPSVSYDPAIAFKAGATFCSRRSALERLLLVLVAVLALVALVLAIVLGSHSHPPPPPPSNAKMPASPQQTSELCLTKVCVTVSSSMMNSMDESVDPCDDFYQYACGGWMKSHPIPAGESRWDTFGVLRKENQIVLKNVLESPQNQSQSESEKKAKLYYVSCLDPNKTIEKLGSGPLLAMMREFGGWPMSSSAGTWNATRWNFQRTIEKVHSLGLSNFFNVWVGEDEKNPNQNILQFDQGGIVLPREQYINRTIKDDKILSAYLKFMVDTGVLLDGERSETERQMLQVIEFEQALANITVPQEERRDDEKMYNKKTLFDLQKMAPFINWTEYLNNLLNATYVLNSSEEVLVYEPNYFRLVSALVQTTLRSPDGKIILHNYMIWHLVKMMSSYLSKPFQDVKKEFIRVLSGISGDEEQWRYCTSDTDGVIGFAVGAMFVRESFHGESKSSAELMINRVKGAFIENLPNLKWMDDETRKAAVDKANAVVDMIGFPEFILNSTRMDERYEELEFRDDEYFLNNYRALIYTMRRNFNKLRQPPEKFSWSMSPATVNAYYTPTKNQIVFPAGILQAPFYDKDYPRSLNYGAMGVVMGHELTHGFDDQGREYDKTGVLRPWWNKESIENFKERTRCMTDQYSKYSVYGENLKGKQTLGENIADNGGLKSAYYAYEEWTKENGEEVLLPGLNFTHRQLFFLAFAQVWCTNSRAEDSHNSILSDPHSLPRFRVIGPISNSHEFSQQFKCPTNSTMNPTTKCEVW